ncbi:copper uptake system-associated protein [Bradyrhizobium sp. 193]|uniref:copper uptake system-associated protein n=1 Tax=Bradyrhizobium sp. 193 TaxID=2782661 RepID=UPI001FFBEAD0|nr:copper uptake system-associated protein [Bradyrhizobium sp. 193]
MTIRDALGVVALLSCLISTAAAGSDKDAIRHLLHGTFDKPDAQLVVEPIVVASDYAIAAWTQDDIGGGALLRRKGGEWAILLCSGDALKSADTLLKAGVPQSAAVALENDLAISRSRSRSQSDRAVLALRRSRDDGRGGQPSVTPQMKVDTTCRRAS